MFYIPVFNGSNSEPGGMNSIGLMSINGIIAGSKDGSYENLFQASGIHLLDTDELDTTRLHGDGSNTVVKKGVMVSDTPGTKHQKGEKEVTITDNHGFIIGPITISPVNAHDTTIFARSLQRYNRL